MNDVLANIVAHKRMEVDAARSAVSESELRARAAEQAAPRNFFQAVSQPGKFAVNLIAEVKRKSPSAGEIKQDGFDPAGIASVYHHGGASAISCLTDEKFFDGKLEYIEQIKARVPLPVLRKDFIIDPYQVVESRAAGADAILLIAECLTQGLLCDLMIQAIELNMTCLVEVYEAESLVRVHDIMQVPMRQYTILGINNRNLRTQTIDLSNTGRIMSLLEERYFPVVAESGVRTAADVQRLAAYGVSGLLIGETLMRSSDPAGTIRELFNPISRSETNGQNGHGASGNAG